MLAEAREARQLDLFQPESQPAKKRSSEGNPHGNAYEMLVGAHMHRLIRGETELGDHHFPHSTSEHASDTEHGQHKETKQSFDKLSEKLGKGVISKIDSHASEDAQSMINHLKAINHPDYESLASDVRAGKARMVHVPHISSLKDVVYKGNPEKKSLSSTADIVLTNGKKHIGIDTKYGRPGGVSIKTTTHPSLEGVLKKGRGEEESKKVKFVATRVGQIQKTTENEKKRRLVMKVLAGAHEKAFNKMSDEERKKAVSRLMNAGEDTDIRTFVLHRDPYRKKSSANITEPSAQFKKENENATFRAQRSGQGFNIIRNIGGRSYAYSRVGISSRGSGANPSIIKTNVRRQKEKEVNA